MICLLLGFKGIWFLTTNVCSYSCCCLYCQCVSKKKKNNKKNKKVMIFKQAEGEKNEKKCYSTFGTFSFLLAHLCDVLLLLHAGNCSSPIIVVVGRVRFGSARLLHHRLHCRHIGCSISDERNMKTRYNFSIIPSYFVILVKKAILKCICFHKMIITASSP